MVVINMADENHHLNLTRNRYDTNPSYFSQMQYNQYNQGKSFDFYQIRTSDLVYSKQINNLVYKVNIKQFNLFAL